MKDFSRERPAIEFKIDDDVFTAVSAIPADTMIGFSTRFEGVGENPTSADGVKIMTEMLQTILTSQSYDLFKARMSDPLRPIDMNQLNEVMEWVLGELGMRPTEPSESSSDGQPSPESGTSSTANTQDVVLISSVSPSTAS